jgi:hypothetical protein
MPATKLNDKDNAKLSEDQKRILGLLVEHKTLTTSQVRDGLNTTKSLRQVQRDLKKLNGLAMVESFAVTNHQRGANEDNWLLLKTGASAIGANYDSNYSRHPTPKHLEKIAQELELKNHIVQQAGWKLLTPLTFNRGNPKPEQTEQAKLILEFYSQELLNDLIKRREINPKELGLSEEIKDYKVNMHRSRVPKDANEWVAYLEFFNAANERINLVLVILIICPNQAGTRYWKYKIEKYRKIASKVKIYAVFPTAEEARKQIDLLKKAGFRVTILDYIIKVLNRIKEKGE